MPQSKMLEWCVQIVCVYVLDGSGGGEVWLHLLVCEDTPFIVSAEAQTQTFSNFLPAKVPN